MLAYFIFFKNSLGATLYTVNRLENTVVPGFINDIFIPLKSLTRERLRYES